MMMVEDVEQPSLISYSDKPRTFPDMRTKTHSPLIIRILRNLNVRVLSVLLFLSFGGIFYVGARTSPIIVVVFVVCIISFMLSVYLTKWVLTKDEGPPEMVQVSDAIRDGAEGFFRTQTMSAYITVAAFLLGALCSGIAGYVGMWVSVRANVRVSSAARRSAKGSIADLYLLGPNSASCTHCEILSGGFNADSRSSWWILSPGCCWYGCDWYCHPVFYILCMVGRGFTRLNEG